MNDAALDVNGLTIGYPGRVVCSGIGFAVRKGELVALLGRNGSGKSTLLKTLTGRLAPVEGNMTIAGFDVKGMKLSRMARVVSIVTPERGDDLPLSARETVELGRHPFTGFMGRLSRHDHSIVEQAMKDTGCLHLAERRVGSLSDGERQKVLIARALAQDTPVMLLDEPFSFIDVAARLELMRLLRGIAASHDKAILFSTHDVAQAFRYADRLLCFTTDGRLEAGTAYELIARNVPDQLFREVNVRFDPSITDYRLLS